ncbi:MAG: TIGR02300 family protein [Caulobacteraceae bacterium]|nr:TIGR02300 family protein [Caulobacter sp.]
MASPELGTKQICPNCQTKFYDLNKRPAHCPKCGTEFDPEDALRSRRSRTRVSPADTADDEVKETPVHDEAEDQEEEEATPEIDAAAEETVIESDEDDSGEGAAAGGDLGVGEDEGDDEDSAGDDVPFLEDEEEDLGDDDIEGLPDNGEEER